MVSSGAGGEAAAEGSGVLEESTYILESSASFSFSLDGVDGADDLDLFLLRVIAIILQVKFSIREAFGKVSLAFVYSRHTCVARGSFLLFSSASSLNGSSVSESESRIAAAPLGFFGGNRESDKRTAAIPDGVDGDNAEAFKSFSVGFSISFMRRLGRFLFPESMLPLTVEKKQAGRFSALIVLGRQKWIEDKSEAFLSLNYEFIWKVYFAY